MRCAAFICLGLIVGGILANDRNRGFGVTGGFLHAHFSISDCSSCFRVVER